MSTITLDVGISNGVLDHFIGRSEPLAELVDRSLRLFLDVAPVAAARTALLVDAWCVSEDAKAVVFCPVEVSTSLLSTLYTICEAWGLGRPAGYPNRQFEALLAGLMYVALNQYEEILSGEARA